MEDVLKKALIELGCSQREIKFYLASVSIGSSPIATIASKAKLSRSTAYLVASQLIDRKLVSQDYRQYKKLLTATSPQQVLRKLEAKHRRLGRSSLALKENLSDIEAYYRQEAVLPIVKTYQGSSALMAIQSDIMRSKNEVSLWSNQSAERKFFNQNQRQAFINQRIEHGIHIRVLAVDNSEARQLLATDPGSLRQTRILPIETQFTPETYIYGDNVAMIDYDTDIFGIIIKNRLIAQSQRSIFNQTWHSQD